MVKSQDVLNKKNKIYYVDLILPLAIPQLLTYEASFNPLIEIGQRVLVHVGKKKEY